jgi:putative flippase GtrA
MEIFLLGALLNLGSRRSFRYLVVGGINTGIGYVVGVLFLIVFSGIMITPVIAILSSFITLNVNYFLYKTIVFKTVSSWKVELIRFYKVNLVSTAVAVCSLTILIDYLGVSILLGQALSMILTIVVAAVGNFVFAFRE